MIKRMTQPITLRGIPVRQRSIGIDIGASKIRSALIDVSAEQVVIIVYWNDEPGLADLLKSCRWFEPDVVVLEPTRWYSTLISRALMAAGLTTVIVDAERMKRLRAADAKMTDSLDSLTLALYGITYPGPWATS